MTDAAEHSPSDTEAGGTSPAVSIDVLAEKVFRLLQRDLELERRRTGIPRERHSRS